MSVVDFLREAEALRRLAGKEQREVIRRHDLRETFREIHTQLDEQLRADMARVQQQLQRLRNDVFRFQEQLVDVRPSPDVIDRLKLTMTEIENSISVFKDTQHQRFEELLKDERTLWTEIGSVQKKMDVWCLPVRAGGRLPCAHPDSSGPAETRNLPPEVTALETFLQQTGGQSGGWDEYDHQSFLRVWTKHGGRPSYRQEVRLYLPGRSEEEVRQHEDWHTELRRLQERKREAVLRWRAAKQNERERQREQQDRQQEDEDEEEEEEERLMREQRRREVSERLEAWRMQRTQEREQERETQLRDEIRRRRRAKEERRRQLELKMQVEAHVQRRKQEEELRVRQEEERERAEREERHRLTVDGIRRFQERDSLLLEEKLQEKQSREEQQRERQRTLDKLKQKVELHIRRDPSRLQRPTKVWEERSKVVGPSGAAPMLRIFHRAVPTWRQDI